MAGPRTQEAGAARRSRAGLLSVVIGPAVTLFSVGLIELLGQTGFGIPNPPAVLVLTVVFAAYIGGVIPGLVSALIAWGYFAYFFSLPGEPFQYNIENLRRVAIWLIATPSMAVMVGVLQRRSLKAHDAAIENAVLQAQLAERSRAEVRLREAYEVVATENSERRLAEERQSLLVRELDHRVKNTLATVLAVADETLRSAPTPEAFSESFHGRIAALVRAHSLLAQVRWGGVGLGELARATMEPFLGGRQERIRVDGPDCLLPPQAAQPLCMAFHELATNAIKYGALSDPDGTVSLSWVCDGPANMPDRVHLSWEERGGPEVTAPKVRGFGTTLIREVLPHQIGAEVRVDFHPSGLIWQADLSLSETRSDQI